MIGKGFKDNSNKPALHPDSTTNNRHYSQHVPQTFFPIHINKTKQLQDPKFRGKHLREPPRETLEVATIKRNRPIKSNQSRRATFANDVFRIALAEFRISIRF